MVHMAHMVHVVCLVHMVRTVHTSFMWFIWCTWLTLFTWFTPIDTVHMVLTVHMQKKGIDRFLTQHRLKFYDGCTCIVQDYQSLLVYLQKGRLGAILCVHLWEGKSASGECSQPSKYRALQVTAAILSLSA